MTPVEYRGVKISIEPGQLARPFSLGYSGEVGYFTLCWPGHDPERIQSQWKQYSYILAESKEFVDAWLEDGYIQLPTPDAGSI